MRAMTVHHKMVSHIEILIKTYEMMGDNRGITQPWSQGLYKRTERWAIIADCLEIGLITYINL